MARPITPFLLQTRFEVDPKQGRAAFKTITGDVDKLGVRFTKLGKEITTSMKGAEAGRRFGADFSAGATSVITGSIKSLGQTIGSLVGTVLLPGIGTAVGSTIGSAIDVGLEKVSGPIIETIQRGIELNELLEQTRVEFTSFAGSAKEADEYLERLTNLSLATGKRLPFLVEASESLYDFTGNLKLSGVLLQAAVDKAADIGGGVGTIRAIGDALGLIVEKGDLSAQSLKKLYRMKINAPQLIAEATGWDVNKVNKLIAEGRIRGDVAARAIAEGLLRQSGGFAEKLGKTTSQGKRETFEATKEILAARATINATKKLGDLYGFGTGVLQTEGAGKFADFLNDKTGALFSMVEQATGVGVSVAQGLGSGLTSSESLKSLSSSIKAFSGSMITSFKDDLGIKSPSKRMETEIGVPMGEGIALGILPGFQKVFEGQVSNKIKDLIEKYAKEFGVPPELVSAVVWQESRGKTKAVSPKGAAGLGQLMPATAKRFGVTDRFDPEQNIRASVQYLKFLIDKFDGKLELVLAGYNAGEGAVEKYGNKVPPYRETRDYVAKITAALSGSGTGARFIAASPQKVDPKTVWGDPAEFLRVTKLFTPQERKHIEQLGVHISETMKEIAAVNKRLNTAREDLALANSRPAGFDPNRETRAAILVDSLSERHQRLSESLSKLSSESQQLVQASVSRVLLEEQAAADRLAAEKAAELARLEAARAYALTLNKGVPAARDFRNILQGLSLDTLPAFTSEASSLEAMLRTALSPLEIATKVGLPPLTAAEIDDLGRATRKFYGVTAESMKEFQNTILIDTVSFRDRVFGALSQGAGFLPQEEVGKKRGFFSKLLGFAAPFLSFIPGVGPILSTLAGIGSNAAAGNWAGVATGVASGFSTGGAFRRTPTSTSAPSTSSPGNFTGAGLEPRARGGPVRRGRAYLVGEQRPEMFVPQDDGWIHSQVGDSSSPGNNAILLQMLQQLSEAVSENAAALSQFRSIPPDQVVMKGAHGLIRSMDNDAGLIRLMGQRMRGS